MKNIGNKDNDGLIASDIIFDGIEPIKNNILLQQLKQVKSTMNNKI